MNNKIIFLGTPKFAATILENLIANGYKPIAVITEPDRTSGRGKKIVISPVKQMALDNEIPVFQPEKISTINSQLLTLDADLGIVAAYGQIIPKEILDIPKLGFINVHPSLLPKYRGPSPIHATILNQDTETGVSIIKLDEKMDHGPILAKQEFSIFNFSRHGGTPPRRWQFSNNSEKIEANYKNLSGYLSKIGAELLIKILPDYLKGGIQTIPQDDSRATYTRLIKKEDALISWDDKPENIVAKIKAFCEWPKAYTIIENIRFIINDAHMENGLLVIDRIQPESKNVMDFKDFAKGYSKILTKFPGYVKIK